MTALRCLVALLLTAPGARAQEEPRMGRLEAGMKVRVETTEGRRLEGIVTTAGSSSLVLTDRVGERHRLTRSQLRRAWQSTPSTGLYARRAAIAGAVAFGGYLGLLSGGLCEEESCTGAFIEGIAVGAPLGAFGGAALGAALGALVHRWTPIHDAGPEAVPSETGWRVHLGLAERTGGDGPDPVALIRVAGDRQIGTGRWGFLELSHVAYSEDRLQDASRDARTWSLALGLTEALTSDPAVRLSASAGVARSSASFRFDGSPPAREFHNDGVQYGTQLSVGVETAHRFSPRIEAGLEARYDYVPLFFDGVHFLTLSVAVGS